MQADQFRILFDYHFYLNHKIWAEAVSQLSNDQFVEDLGYSLGSVRNQIVHMLDTDRRWFTGLRGEEPRGYSNPVHFGKQRDKVLAHRKLVEDEIRATLTTLDDDSVNAPYPESDGKLMTWQVLFHMLAHGIDHRAQLLAALNQLGVQTFPQDYALYLFGRI
jgi:uncharacterized damage-inducible protein DinB